MAEVFSKEQRLESLYWLIDLLATAPTRPDEVTASDDENDSDEIQGEQ